MCLTVAGGCKDSNSSNWMEVFDPKTGVWENVLSPERNIPVNKSAGIDGRIYYMFGKEGLVYKPKESRWETIGVMAHDLGLQWSQLSYCVVDNVLYCHRGCSTGFSWYDSKRHTWIYMDRVKGLPQFANHACVKLAAYGGKLAVLWKKYIRSSGYKEKRIWCAVIVLKKRKSSYNNYDDIWGDVEWLGPVLTVPSSFHFACALAATV